MRKRRFFYHWNKPMSLQMGKSMWSVHFDGKCHFTEKIVCHPIAESHARKTQPKAIMRGFASQLIHEKDKITILI